MTQGDGSAPQPPTSPPPTPPSGVRPATWRRVVKRVLGPFVAVAAVLYFLIDALFYWLVKPIAVWLGRQRILEGMRDWIRSLRPLSDAPRSSTSSRKHVLRQDPDVVLIGEMRDLETIEAALTVAETGHLVFSTLHTNSAVQTINRVIDVFPPHQQAQVRAQLSLVLQAVISQTAAPAPRRQGPRLGAEVMIPNPAIRNLIREEKVHQIYSQMQVGQSKFGMQTMTQSLLDLVQRRLIIAGEALGHATEPEELKQMLGLQGRRRRCSRPRARRPRGRR